MKKLKNFQRLFVIYYPVDFSELGILMFTVEIVSLVPESFKNLTNFFWHGLIKTIQKCVHYFFTHIC